MWDWSINIPTLIAILGVGWGLFSLGLGFRDEVRDMGFKMESHKKRIETLEANHREDHEKVITMWDRLSFGTSGRKR